MNIFGLMFSFLIPGVVLGLLIAAAISEDGKSAGRKVRRNTVAQSVAVNNGNKLFVCSMADDCKPHSGLKLIKGAESRKKLYICSVDGNKAA